MRSKLREMGRLRLMPRMLALRAVQRQTAASRSTRPSRREQQGFTGGLPKVTLRSDLSTSAHTPSFRASLGQDPLDGVGVGVGLGEGQPPQAEVTVKKTRLKTRNRATRAEVFEAIGPNLITNGSSS